VFTPICSPILFIAIPSGEFTFCGLRGVLEPLRLVLASEYSDILNLFSEVYMLSISAYSGVLVPLTMFVSWTLPTPSFGRALLPLYGDKLTNLSLDFLAFSSSFFLSSTIF
jgi:hypothetical protein